MAISESTTALSAPRGFIADTFHLRTPGEETSRGAAALPGTPNVDLPALVEEWRAAEAAAWGAHKLANAAVARLDELGIPLYAEASQDKPAWQEWDSLIEAAEDKSEISHTLGRQVIAAQCRSTADLLAKLQFIRAHMKTEGIHPDDLDFEVLALDRLIEELPELRELGGEMVR